MGRGYQIRGGINFNVVAITWYAKYYLAGFFLGNMNTFMIGCSMKFLICHDFMSSGIHIGNGLSINIMVDWV